MLSKINHVRRNRKIIYRKKKTNLQYILFTEFLKWNYIILCYEETTPFSMRWNNNSIMNAYQIVYYNLIYVLL